MNQIAIYGICTLVIVCVIVLVWALIEERIYQYQKKTTLKTDPTSKPDKFDEDLEQFKKNIREKYGDICASSNPKNLTSIVNAIDASTEAFINNAPFFDQTDPNYNDYLLSDKWSYVRNHVLNRDHHQCVTCGAIGSEVHHLSYDNIYNEECNLGQDLITLCHSCHRRTHSND